MGVYELKDQLNGTTDQLIQQEVHLYGSKRLGIHQQNKLVASYDHTTQQYTTEPIPPPKRIMGNKYYELANHLGNVLSVITDRKLYDAEIATDQNDVPVKLDYETYLSTWNAQTPSACTTPAQFSISNGKLQIDFPPFVNPCAGNSADYKINTVAGETYTVSLKAERGVATDVIAIETRDHINNTVIPTAVWGINIQPGVMEPFIEFTFTATSAETRLKIFSRSDGYTDPTVLYIDQMQILAFERIVADVVSFSDYYPSGMMLPGRYGNSESYRYGFNGMEKDDEISGAGTSYTTEFRPYDARSMRWSSLDPLMAKFPHMSPFAAFDNNPIYYVDPYGLAPGPGDGETPQTKEESGHNFTASQEKGSSSIENLEKLAEKYAITSTAISSQEYDQEMAKIRNVGGTNSGLLFSDTYVYKKNPHKGDMNGRTFLYSYPSRFGSYSSMEEYQSELYEYAYENGHLSLSGMANELRRNADAPPTDYTPMYKFVVKEVILPLMAAAAAEAVFAQRGTGFVPKNAGKGASMAEKSLSELRTIVKKDAAAFRELFGKGKQGAETTLNNIKNVKVPKSLSVESLSAYRELIKRVPDPTGTQAVRAKILEYLLK